MKHVILGGLAFVAAASLAPSRAHAAVPAWCAGEHFRGWRGGLDRSELASGDPRRTMTAIAEALCDPDPEVETHRREIEASFRAWSTRMAMTDADWADVLAYERSPGMAIPTLSTRFPAEFTAIDQYIAIVEGVDVGNGDELWTPGYFADMFGAKLGPLGRYGYAVACTSRRNPTPVDWAVCQPDLDAVEPAALLPAITADRAHGRELKMMLRYEVLELPKLRAAHAAKVAAAVREEPAYQKMFEIAKAAHAGWAATSANDPALLALVADLENASLARSRSKLAGCEARTAAALTAEAAKLPAAAFANVFDERWSPDQSFASAAAPKLIANPRVSLAATAYVLCQDDGITDFLIRSLEDAPGFRGPRMYAYRQIYAANLQSDDASRTINYPPVPTPYTRPGGGPASMGGVVASVTRGDKAITVRFERMPIKREECVASHQTSRVTRIHGDGRVEYEQVCDRMATVVHDEQWDDIQVDARYAALIKPGVRISAVRGTDDGGMHVIATWPSKAAKAPNSLLGGGVK